MLRLGLLAALCIGTAAAACPTCVGPRLGDSEHDVSLTSSTTFGIDWLGKDIQRDELREEVGAAFAVRPRLGLELDVPLVWRWLLYSGDRATSWGVADALLQARVDVLRAEVPESSDTLSLIGGAQSSVSPLTSDPYASQVGSNALTPRVGVQFRHADQGWGVSTQLLGGWPIAYSAQLQAGRWASLTAAADYQATRIIRVQVIASLKAQEHALWSGAPVAATGFFAGFVGAQLGIRATKWLALNAAVFTPVFCVSDGYQHSPVFRLTLDVL